MLLGAYMITKNLDQVSLKIARRTSIFYHHLFLTNFKKWKSFQLILYTKVRTVPCSWWRFCICRMATIIYRLLPWGRTQRHAVGAKVRVFVRNPDELANERGELARLPNKAGTCCLHEISLSTASGLSPVSTAEGGGDAAIVPKVL